MFSANFRRMLGLGIAVFCLAACTLSSVPPTMTPLPTAVVILVTNLPPATSTPLPTSTIAPTSTALPRPTSTPVFNVSHPIPGPVCSLAPTVTAANIRSGPGTNFPVRGALPAGNWIAATRLDGGGWYQVSFPGTPVEGGWISNTVVVLQQPCVCGPNNYVQVTTALPTFTSVPTATSAPPANICALTVLTPNDTVNMYRAPSADSPVFGPFGYGQYVEVVGRTADGWYGFDVAAAQAPNVGLYRLRWIKSDRITLTGAPCGTLKVIEIAAPPPFKDCVVSPVNVSSVSIYGQSGFDAGVAGTLSAGSSLAVVGKTPPNWYGAAGGWYAVSYTADSVEAWVVGRYRLRWIPIDTTTQLGGDCDGLPTVTLDP